MTNRTFAAVLAVLALLGAGGGLSAQESATARERAERERLRAAAAANAATALARSQERRGWLGFAFEAVRSDARETLVVRRVVDDSPAERAGLEAGDTLVRINGSAASTESLVKLSRQLQPGDTVRLQVRRAGRERLLVAVAAVAPRSYVFIDSDSLVIALPDVEVIRGSIRKMLDSVRVRIDSLRLPRIRIERDSGFMFRFDPEMFGPKVYVPFPGDSVAFELRRILPRDSLRKWHFHLDTAGFEFTPLRAVELGNRAVAGAELTELNPALAEYFGAVKEGLLVLNVPAGTPAARAGLQSGDVILRADGKAVRHVRELRSAVARSGDKAVALEVVRKGKRLELTLRRRP